MTRDTRRQRAIRSAAASREAVHEITDRAAQAFQRRDCPTLARQSVARSRSGRALSSGCDGPGAGPTRLGGQNWQPLTKRLLWLWAPRVSPRDIVGMPGARELPCGRGRI